MLVRRKQTAQRIAGKRCIKFLLLLFIMLAAGCSTTSELKSFADAYNSADRGAQVVVRNKGFQKTKPETMMTEEQITEERNKEEPWTLGYPYCTAELIDQGIPNYYAFETGFRKDMLQKIVDAKAEKIDSFKGDPAKEYIAFGNGKDRLTVYQDGRVIVKMSGKASCYQLPETIVEDLENVWYTDWDTHYSPEKKPCWVNYDADGNVSEP